jgi:hypothetical protein
VGKRNLKTLVTVMFVVIAVIPYLYWKETNKIQDRFNDIEFSMQQSNNADSIFRYCETVTGFVSANPIHTDVQLNCSDYELLDSGLVKSVRDDFIGKVHEIDKSYRKQERLANNWMFIILISSHILGALTRRLIDRRLGGK